MGDFAQAQDYNRVTIHTGSPECIGPLMAQQAAQCTTSAAWPSANLAIFVPFLVHTQIIAVKMFTSNGATASGNIDIGIYDSGQNRLVSMGSTAQSGTSAIQTFDIADTLLEPGVYYMALSQSGTTGTFLSSAQIPLPDIRSFGILSQALGSVTLPDPATVAAIANAYIPLFGLTARSLI